MEIETNNLGTHVYRDERVPYTHQKPEKQPQVHNILLQLCRGNLNVFRKYSHGMFDVFHYISHREIKDFQLFVENP
ncbi:hypothetical protein [Chlamydia abortus]|uniref:hypothetical protein n=1 Tax=Chlamydia abortus TaxID=83555 RepID=UPI0015D8EB34|nr:hypothetical protein [Chlamydia abortus]